MIDIVPTTYYQNTEHYRECLKCYGDTNTKLLRINCTRVLVENYIKEIINLRKVYYEINHYYPQILLDLPIPKEKPRLEFKLPIQKERIAKVSGDDCDFFKIYKGEKIIITKEWISQPEILQFKVSGSQFINHTKKGEIVTVGENSARFKVDEKSNEQLYLTATIPGIIPYKKAVYSKSCFNFDSNTYDDYIPLVQMIKPKVIALSFVECGQDIIDFKLRYKIPENTLIMAKLESIKALKEIQSIVNQSDCIMIARGDLLNSTGEYEFGYYIDKFIDAIHNQKPVYIATGFFQSININSMYPSRSDLIDMYYYLKQKIAGVVLTYDSSQNTIYNRCVDLIRNIKTQE
ncbi:pyruvate kinase [Abyssisolibacter fermentans]|uniref:pyruvate kinase n=1 Tax=Abyssisolibacter fermentans TaxID=1766203 RepID=UPI000836E3BD|nr:pyruvate kinase [Abyssisolibacter fermentans]